MESIREVGREATAQVKDGELYSSVVGAGEPAQRRDERWVDLLMGCVCRGAISLKGLCRSFQYLACARAIAGAVGKPAMDIPERHVG